MPIFDTIFKGQWHQSYPWAGTVRPLELILTRYRDTGTMTNVISALTFPFVMLFVPIFNDGNGALSIITTRAR